ncbi:MAG: nucleotidyltransferase family protein [Gemmatimonadota bacterium]
MPTERTGPIAGVVLAAGLSRRLGTNKLLLEVDGVPLVRRAVESAIDAGLAPVLVVVGHERERVESALAGLDCRAVHNPRFAEDGKNGSMKVGVGAVPLDAAGAMVILADMPRVETSMMAALIDAFRTGGAPLVVSRYGDVNAPPMLYDRALFDELLAMQGEGCGKRLVRAHLDEAQILSWPKEALRDLDVPADMDALGARPG